MEEGKEMSAHSLSCKTEEKLDICMSNVSDFTLLTDEKFDFDLSLSSTSGNEDEVFIGPVGHKERCIAASIEAKKSVSAFDEKLTWSPLQGEKFVEIFKEARLLALQIETGSKDKETKITQSEGQENKIVETFVEDSKSKLKILRNKNIEISPRPAKRETYCVQDSSACQLPPCFQKASHKLLSDGEVCALPAPNRSPVKVSVSPTKNADLPLTEDQNIKETNTKATSKLPMAKPSSTLGNSNLLTVDKVKSGKHTNNSIKRDLNSMGSSEDVISDKSSITSDVFESSFSSSSSVQNTKVLPAPSKPGLRKMTYLKRPGIASGLTRKTTSSSSSSSVSSMNSSLNSSLPISPIGKKGKASTSSKASVSGSKLPSSMSRLALVRPTAVPSLQAANTEKSRKQVRSASTPKISSAVSLAKSSASATSCEAAGSGIQRPSSVPSLQQLCQQNKDGSSTKGSLCPTPKARVLSVSTSQTKAPMKTYDATPNKSGPKATPSLGLTFCGTPGSAMAVSTPMKASEDKVFQSFCFPERSATMTPASVKRSGLPTPVRRISGFPAVTPKTVPRAAFSPHAASLRQSFSFSTKKTLTAGSKQKQESKTQTSSEGDTSPPPVLPLALNFSPEKTATEGVENALKEAEVQNELTEVQNELALLLVTGVDKSLPYSSECESRPLIDLSNTPEVSKIISPKPVLSGQIKLIDLSSPLITLSPDVNKENLDSPLLKF
uniref:G2 and S-phase expressed 1 n=1 Tax=Malurus cyaneus samueli TaxID=2593467 RepID=A0A8C5TM45_9PASS